MVSEFMLQQTQVARVRIHLPRWLERFPSLAALAAASRRDVLIAWSGMGYNRRALHLHAAARVVMERHDGVLPSDPTLLRRLPGFGRYTAHAVACFGFHTRHAMVEVNIRRVLSRITTAMEREDRILPDAAAWELAETFLPRRAYFDWNQALMDLGALVCTARRPRCGDCPVATDCASAHRLEPAPPTVAATASVGAPLTVAATATVMATSKHVPRRIYRGKVVEYLRARHCANAATLHRLLFGAREEERTRLLDILASLRKDGMIVVTPRQALGEDPRQCTTALRALRVCLAE